VESTVFIFLSPAMHGDCCSLKKTLKFLLTLNDNKKWSTILQDWIIFKDDLLWETLGLCMPVWISFTKFFLKFLCAWRTILLKTQFLNLVTNGTFLIWVMTIRRRHIKEILCQQTKNSHKMESKRRSFLYNQLVETFLFSSRNSVAKEYYICFKSDNAEKWLQN
jgi:hypothetical protein